MIRAVTGEQVLGVAEVPPSSKRGAAVRLAIIGSISFLTLVDLFAEPATSSRKASVPMSTLAMNLIEAFEEKLEANWQTLSHVVFGAFMGGLVVLLILLNAGVPIVAGV